MEDEFVNESYALKYEKFDKRNITFILTLGSRDKTAVAKEIVEHGKMFSIACTFGDGADLKAEVILETHQEFMDVSRKSELWRACKKCLGLNQWKYWARIRRLIFQ